MTDKLLRIVKHYGIDKQLKYFQSEIFELNEAIITHELKQSVEYEIPLTEIVGTKDHIAEELADVLVMLKQIQLYYGIENTEIAEVMRYKIDRQIRRINEEN